MKKDLLWLVPLFVIFIFFVVYLLVIFNSEETSDFERNITKNEALQFSDLDGGVVDIESIVSSSEFTLVYAWASWCPFCAEDLVYLNDVASNNSQLRVLAINRKESNHQANRFLNTLGELNNVTFLIDVDDNYYSEIGGYSMPEGVLYDQNGAVISHIRGSAKNADIQMLLD